MEQEATFAVLRNQIGCIGIIQNDLRQVVVCSAAYPAIQIIPNLTGENDCIRTLGGQNQMDSKGPAQSSNRFQLAFDLDRQLFQFLGGSVSACNLCHFVTSEDAAFQFGISDSIVLAKTGTLRLQKKLFPPFQFVLKVC